MDYLQEELITFYTATCSNESSSQHHLDFRPAANEHLQRLETFHLAQI